MALLARGGSFYQCPRCRRGQAGCAAIAWRLVAPRDADPALKLVDRIVAILWKMTRG
jgi:hypothetical protein